MNVIVRIVGLEALQKKLDGKFLWQPEVENALDSTANRGMRPRGKKLGVTNNTLSLATRTLERDVGTSLNWPRTKGTSWTKYNLRAMRAVAVNALKKAARNIEKRWSS